jgi:predicted CXXCH cytochrome family protein
MMSFDKAQTHPKPFVVAAALEHFPCKNCHEDVSVRAPCLLMEAQSALFVACHTSQAISHHPVVSFNEAQACGLSTLHK